MPPPRPLVVSFYSYLHHISDTFLVLDIARLWKQASLSLATYNQLAIIANSQISEARRATVEILDLIGYANATEPFLGLASSMTTVEGRSLYTPSLL